MQRNYSVALHLKSTLGEVHHVRTGTINEYLDALDIKDRTSSSGDVLAYTAGGALYFVSDHVVFRPKEPLDATEAIRFALSMAKQLEAVRTGHDLSFNSNFMYLVVGADPEGRHINANDFMPEAQELQKKLYLGGDFGYNESSSFLSIYLGTKEEIKSFPGDKEIVASEGTARPADSLDELLARLNQSQTQ